MRRNMFNNVNVANGNITDIFLQVFDRINNLLHEIVWPIVVVFIILFFRKEIVDFIKWLRIRFNIPGIGPVELRSSQNEETDKNKELELVEDLKREKKELEEVVEKMKMDTDVQTGNANTYYLFWNFEKIYRLIFGSQIELLKTANSYPNGISYSLISSAHSMNGWAKQNYPLESYTQFMVGFELLERDEKAGMYKITQVGRYFLQYIDAFKLPPKLG